MKKRYLFDEDLINTEKGKDEEEVETKDVNKDQLDTFYKKLNHLIFALKKQLLSKDYQKVEKALSDFKTEINKSVTLDSDEDNEDDEEEKTEEVKDKKAKAKDDEEEVEKDKEVENDAFSDEEIEKLRKLLDGDNIDKLLALLEDNDDEEDDENEDESDEEDEEYDEDSNSDIEDEKVVKDKKMKKDSFKSFNSLYDSKLMEEDNNLTNEIVKAWSHRGK